MYDVSGWVSHPGGRVIFTLAGQDATDQFRSFHSAAAYETLASRCVGVVAEGVREVSAFEKEVRELRGKLKSAGLFEASALYYVWKTTEVLGLAGIGIALLHLFPFTWGATLGAAALLATAWQQSGWLSHDYLHHQVFANRFLGDVFGLLLGNVFQGFSVEWWKNKHNTHHAIPNLHESADDRHDGDPDIDTLPFLAWSTHMTDKAKRDGAWTRFFVRHQQLLFFPLLAFARLVWMQQSFAYTLAPLLAPSSSSSSASVTADADTDSVTSSMGVTGTKGAWSGAGRITKQLRYPVAEPLLLLCHYAWVAYLMIAYMTPLQAVAFLLASECLSGLMLATAFVVGHNGMECFDADAKPDFAEMQVRSTRNIDDDGFSGWFTGGLHLQIEHHLFPTMPRHNLHKVRPIVEALCKTHGIPYRSTSLLEGVGEVLGCLHEMALPIVRDFPAM